MDRNKIYLNICDKYAQAVYFHGMFGEVPTRMRIIARKCKPDEKTLQKGWDKFGIKIE